MVTQRIYKMQNLLENILKVIKQADNPLSLNDVQQRVGQIQKTIPDKNSIKEFLRILVQWKIIAGYKREYKGKDALYYALKYPLRRDEQEKLKELFLADFIKNDSTLFEPQTRQKLWDSLYQKLELPQLDILSYLKSQFTNYFDVLETTEEKKK